MASFSSPWPDPNSSVLSKIDFGVPLVELFKWLDVRDVLLGENEREQDITSTLALARDCKHPDAEWLTSIFEGKDVSTEEVFLHCENDTRALSFAWLLARSREEDFLPLHRSSEMGNAFACSMLCGKVWFENKEEAFRLAQLSASKHERDGFFWLGFCFRDGFGCEKDLTLAKENFTIAAELGHVGAAVDYGRSLDKSDPARWLWLGRAALRGWPHSFLDSFSEQVEQYFSGSGNATVMFFIGRALKANIDMEKKEIFGASYNFDSWIGPSFFFLFCFFQLKVGALPERKLDGELFRYTYLELELYLNH